MSDERQAVAPAEGLQQQATRCALSWREAPCITDHPLRAADAYFAAWLERERICKRVLAVERNIARSQWRRQFLVTLGVLP